MSFNTPTIDAECFSHEYFLKEDVCRLCWSSEADREIISKSLKEYDGGTNGFTEKIRYCLGIHIDLHSYPKNACVHCYNKIEEYYKFKSSCLKADIKLQEIIFNYHNKQEKISKVITENNDNSMKESSNHDFDDIFDSFQVTEHSTFSNDLRHCEHEENKALVSKELTNKTCQLIQVESWTKINVKKPVRSKSTCPSKSSSGRNSLSNDLNLVTNSVAIKKEKSNLIKKKKYKPKRSATYCNICRLDLVTIHKMAIHNAENHGIEDEGSSFKCFGCDKRFKTRKARLRHELDTCKGLKDGYKCSKCDRFLPRRSTYEAHMRDHRQNPLVELPENIFQCGKCFELFKTKNCLKEHMAEHDSGKKAYVCETCGRVFSRRDYLHKHKLVHSGTKHHVCPHCGYKASQRSTLTVHMRRHTGERPYSCDMCPQRCISSSNLLAHRRRHLGDKKFLCAICNKQFGYKISLEEHIASVHERSQSFACEQCGALYTRARGLRRHLLIKHGKQKKTAEKERKIDKSEMDDMYLKMTAEISAKKSDAKVDFDIKDGEEFVLLNSDSDVILSKIYE